MRRQGKGSRKRLRPPINTAPDYPLQGTALDVPINSVLSLSAPLRHRYVLKLLSALAREIRADRMALKRRVPFAKEMRDLRRLLYAPPDKYLYTDENTRKRNVLGRGSPGATHTFWSRAQMWKMATKIGNLHDMILENDPTLVRLLERLFDPANPSKASLRDAAKSAIENALQFLQLHKGSGAAFPPFHAKFFADKYLPKAGDGILIDPCAGWGGRLIGSMCVNRAGHVRYYGVDPEKRNRPAYEGLERRINIWLKKELSGKRSARVFYQPFEDWIGSKIAMRLRGTADLVLTSPPYFQAENYNPSNKKQSANRYGDYPAWREKFYRPLMKGAYDLLKPGGVFVLNIADVAEARKLERDARKLAQEVGFENAGFYKLAMSISPGQRKQKSASHTVKVNGALFKYEPVFCFEKPVKRGRPERRPAGCFHRISEYRISRQVICAEGN